MSFLGKEFQFEKQERFDEFLKSLGLGDDAAQKIASFKPFQKLAKDGDNYVFSTNTPEGVKDLKFKLGEEFDEPMPGNQVSKTVFNLDGNVLTQTQTFANGVVLTFKREFSDDSLVVSASSNKWDGVSRRYYKA